MDKARPQSHPGSISLYTSAPYPCSYLPGRKAITAITDPAVPMTTALYSKLADYGFRRSGGYVYRPQCPQCSACLSARIPVAEFHPNRSQRRTWARNEDVQVRARTARFDREHFELYQRYLQARHADGEMNTTDPARYREFICSGWCDTVLYEFRCTGKLLAVAVCDRLRQGLSAVYTYYDPDATRRALGVYAVLWQIAEARRTALPWVYLGYWIAACPKMSYKSRYHPLEIYRDGCWQHLTDEAGL